MCVFRQALLCATFPRRPWRRRQTPPSATSSTSTGGTPGSTRLSARARGSRAWSRSARWRPAPPASVAKPWVSLASVSVAAVTSACFCFWCLTSALICLFPLPLPFFFFFALPSVFSYPLASQRSFRFPALIRFFFSALPVPQIISRLSVSLPCGPASFSAPHCSLIPLLSCSPLYLHYFPCLFLRVFLCSGVLPRHLAVP